ncbi:MAG: M20 family metallopeptidase [Chloroflexi bacterium]|nr:M20 family metallopeptidase [Chloroflexota bacterium]
MSLLNKQIEASEADMVAFLQSLVRIATVNPPGERYEECAGVLDKRLRALGMTTQVVRVPDEIVAKTYPDSAGYARYNVIGRWDVGAPRTLHFNAHYDVVPVSGAWKHDSPFNPVVEDGWVYGRGSGDMKGAIASLITALQALKACDVMPHVNIEVSLTADEEVGGELGAGWIVRQGLVKPDYAIECEGGGKDNAGYGHNGVLWFRSEVTGKPAHASQPHKGINAFEGAASIVNHMQPIKKTLTKRAFTQSNGKVMHPTINIGGVFGVGGGAKVNTVPGQAWFTIDRRIVPSERLKDAEREVLAALRAAKARTPKVKLDVSVFQRIDPCVSDPDSAFHRQFSDAVRAVRGKKPKWSVVSGFTDLHWYVHDLKLPGIGYGPGGESAHGINERAKIEDLVSTAKVYARFMETFKP